MRKAAAALGVAKNAINQSMVFLKRKAARSGYSPAHDMTAKTVPDGFRVKGVSTWYGKRWKSPRPVGQVNRGTSSARKS